MGSSAGPNIIDDGLIFCVDAKNTKSYPGSGTTWSDLSRSGNHGTLTNSPTFNSTGYFDFDGTNDQVTMGTNPFLGGAKSTVEFVLSFDAVTNAFTEQPWCEFGSASNNAIRLYFIRNNSICVGYYANDKVFSFTPSINTIYNITITEDGTGGVELFVDGTLRDTGNLSTPNTSGNTFRIGTFNSTNGSFNGKIYLARLYNRDLTASEVLQNYNVQRSRFGV
tara:strand:- start:537 stop:1202 length:666 start_codon:yes stop_codon:yes gene_type:complete